METDYISRQEFRKELINTPFHPRCETTPDLLTSVQDRLNDTLELLENFPAADVRPVVLCRDCIYDDHCFAQSIFEEMSRIPFDKNRFFCADGKRRDGGADG